MLAVRGLAEVLALGLNALVIIIASRAVGPTYFGTLAIAAAIGQIGIILGNAGISTYGGQRVALQPHADASSASTSSVWWSVVASRALPTVGVVVLGLGCASLLVLDPTLSSFLVVISVSLLSVPFKSEWLLVALGRVQAVAFVRASGAAATAILTILLIHTEADAQFLPLIFVVPLVTTSILGTAIIASSGFADIGGAREIGVGVVRAYIRSGWHYLRADAAVFVYANSDRLFLYAFSGPTILGLYDAAYKLLQPFYAVGAVVGDSLYRQLARALHTPDFRRVFRRWVDLMGAPTVPLGFVCLVYGPWIIELIYGSQYVDAGPYLALLGWVVTVGYCAGIITIPFSAWSVPREYGNSILAGGVVSLALNAALIPTFAGSGAAIATICAKFAVGVVGFRYFRQITDYPVLRDLGFYAAIAALCVLLAWLSGQLGIAVPAQLALAVAIYALIIGLARFRPIRRRQPQRAPT